MALWDRTGDLGPDVWTSNVDRSHQGEFFNPPTTALPDEPATGPSTEEGDQLLPDWAMGDYDRWVAPEGSGGGGGGGGGGGAGNVGGMPGFDFQGIQYNPYGGEDIAARDFGETIEYDPFDETIAYDPYAGSYTADRFGGATDPYRGEKFAAPSYEQAMADPGYQFRLRQGQQALENTAAARGMLRTGGTMKGLMDYNQALASQEYDKTYGRALGEYQMGYGQESTADREQFAREAQKFGMNRQAALDQYDRDFQRHQANQAGLAGAFSQRAGIHQMNQAGLAGAFGQRAGIHQMDVSGELAARQSNLMKYGQNLAAEQGAWDRMYMGGKDKYGFAMQRASQMDAAAQASAARGERLSDKEYNRARADYLLGYEQNVYRDATRWDREQDYLNTPFTQPPPSFGG